MAKVKFTKAQREFCLNYLREEHEKARKAISEHGELAKRVAILETVLKSAKEALAQNDDLLSKYVTDAIDKLVK